MNENIYNDISARTDGDIYIGVVGPVRTGKSTFIKNFMEQLVIPGIENPMKRDRANDELPQSSSGKTIMTTEPKFIPNEAVEISIDDTKMKVRLIDCVGYIVPSALGYIEQSMPRMVQTPWQETPMPFNDAAEIGTKKVITEHSTIGIVITTDGTFGDIPRDDYIDAEKRVVEELKQIRKPFVLVINSADPAGENTHNLAKQMKNVYGVPALPIDCSRLCMEDIKEIIKNLLYEFPVSEVDIKIPAWIDRLSDENWLKTSIQGSIIESCRNISKLSEIAAAAEKVAANDNLECAMLSEIDLSCGKAVIEVKVFEGLFYKILSDELGMEIEGEETLIDLMSELVEKRKKYDRMEEAIQNAYDCGYGIVTPNIGELTLEKPEIVKQGGKYGVKLKASAPSIHLIRADIETEVSPVVGSEKQSEDLVKYLLEEFEENPEMIWESNIFGKSLHELVNEGLLNKLTHMPEDARLKIQETLQRIINDGSGGLICIIL